MFFVLLTVCIFLFLLSCSDSMEEIDPGEPEYICTTMDEFIYENILYSRFGDSSMTRHIRCYDLSSPECESYRLIADALGETKPGVFELGSDACFFW